MSLFVCGVFNLRNARDAPGIKRLGWTIAEAGSREGLQFYLYSGIPQPIVFEITGFSFEKAKSQIPFLITDSPVSNVSDDLFEDQGAAMSTLAKLRRVFERLAGDTTGVDLYMDNGFGEVELVETTLDEFEAAVLMRFDGDEIPSMCVCIRW
jgi:hypothetical protein